MRQPIGPLGGGGRHAARRFSNDDFTDTQSGFVDPCQQKANRFPLVIPMAGAHGVDSRRPNRFHRGSTMDVPEESGDRPALRQEGAKPAGIVLAHVGDESMRSRTDVRPSVKADRLGRAMSEYNAQPRRGSELFDQPVGLPRGPDVLRRELAGVFVPNPGVAHKHKPNARLIEGVLVRLACASSEVGEELAQTAATAAPIMIPGGDVDRTRRLR